MSQKSWYLHIKMFTSCQISYKITNGDLSVFLWLSCYLTIMLPKQSWWHFEALDCIFHFCKKKISPLISWLPIKKIERFRTYGGPCILDYYCSDTVFADFFRHKSTFVWIRGSDFCRRYKNTLKNCFNKTLSWNWIPLEK